MSSQPEVTGATPGSAGAALPEALPDRETHNPLLRYVVHLGLPVSLSLIVHLGVIVFLALKIFELPGSDAPDIGQWSGSVVAAEDVGAGFQWNDQRMPDAPADTAHDDALDRLSAFRPGAADLGALDARAPGPGIGDASGLGLGDGSLSLLGTGSGAGEAGTGGFGSGLGGGAPLGQAGIWNVSVRANHVAYVIDYSGSIVTTVDYLKRELKRSVGRLVPSQSFDVILFYGEFEGARTDSFRAKLEPADKDTRQEFFRWIDRKAPRGDTDPLPAIQRALALKPEVIFFFSDGLFADSVVTDITRANHDVRARIYCIVFDEILLEDRSDLPRDTEGAVRLKRIAESNGGRVKVVTRKDLGE